MSSFNLKHLIELYEDGKKKSAKRYFDEHIFITTSMKVYVLINNKLKCFTREQVEFLYINRMPESLQKYFLTTPNVYRIIRDRKLPMIGEDFINLSAKKEIEIEVEEPSQLDKYLNHTKETTIEVKDFKTAHKSFATDFD